MKSESQNRLLFVVRVSSTEVVLSNEHIEYERLTVEEAIAQWPHPFWSVGLKYAIEHNLPPK